MANSYSRPSHYRDKFQCDCDGRISLDDDVLFKLTERNFVHQDPISMITPVTSVVSSVLGRKVMCGYFPPQVEK